MERRLAEVRREGGVGQPSRGRIDFRHLLLESLLLCGHGPFLSLLRLRVFVLLDHDSSSSTWRLVDNSGRRHRGLEILVDLDRWRVLLNQAAPDISLRLPASCQLLGSIKVRHLIRSRSVVLSVLRRQVRWPGIISATIRATAHAIHNIELIYLLHVSLRRLFELPVLVPVHSLPLLRAPLHHDLLHLRPRLLAPADGLIDNQIATKLLMVEFLIRLTPDQRFFDILAVVSRRLAPAEAGKLLQGGGIEVGLVHLLIGKVKLDHLVRTAAPFPEHRILLHAVGLLRHLIRILHGLQHLLGRRAIHLALKLGIAAQSALLLRQKVVVRHHCLAEGNALVIVLGVDHLPLYCVLHRLLQLVFIQIFHGVHLLQFDMPRGVRIR